MKAPAKPGQELLLYMVTFIFFIVLLPALRRAKHAVLPFGKERFLTVPAHPKRRCFVRHHQRKEHLNGKQQRMTTPSG